MKGSGTTDTSNNCSSISGLSETISFTLEECSTFELAGELGYWLWGLSFGYSNETTESHTVSQTVSCSECGCTLPVLYAYKQMEHEQKSKIRRIRTGGIFFTEHCPFGCYMSYDEDCAPCSVQTGVLYSHPAPALLQSYIVNPVHIPPLETVADICAAR